jgi:hypothetical protein
MSEIDTLGVPEKSYVAGGDAFLYPGAGDQVPPGGAKVLLLTQGGVCTIGQWSDDGFFLGWAPLPKRDKVKEALL